MKRVLPTEYSLYEPVYGTDLPLEQHYLVMYDAMPSKYSDNEKIYDLSVVEYFKNVGFDEKLKIFTNSKRYNNINDIVLVNVNKQINIKCTIKTEDNKKDKVVRLEFLYNLEKGEITSQIDFEKLLSIEKKKSKSNINLVKSEMGHLDIEEFNLTIPDIDLELNYGSEFLKIHNVVVDKLNTNFGKGIILLHGDPGTGKTSYIKYLTSLIKEKEVLFVPPSMAEMISEPSIIPFLMEQKNSILIIEDAERIISDREGNGSPAGVSNILNLTDGILGDCLGIQIVATFNMRREKIDQALLRKGRLIAEHKFEKLNIEETNKLLQHLGKDFVSKESMALADIYNVDVEVFKSNKKSKVGF